MAKVKAVNVIQYAKTPGKPAENGRRAVPPKTETLQPGTIFDSTVLGDSEQELRDAGAFVDASDEEAKTVDTEATGGAQQVGGRRQSARAPQGGGEPLAAPQTAGSAAKAKAEGKPDGTDKLNQSGTANPNTPGQNTGSAPGATDTDKDLVG